MNKLDFHKLFNHSKALIGMVHLPAFVGTSINTNRKINQPVNLSLAQQLVEKRNQMFS